ncbi:hypothetical protein BT96DRAFT_997167 [Gymnopus androsaceus JB14]|uniref:Uncharacterized protein n=1 Tax=Gymnopus androsaceus JB14 TaxID=1447944 RepID=A0A6A4HDF9_9AGAR|nr:hypothetical protein BT96DRAFT_997167 [Gymnopus androsaceus JB14]
MASSTRSFDSSSAHSSPSTISSLSVSEVLRTPPFPLSPTSEASLRHVDDRRTSSLRASVFDAFAELGAFDENSEIAEWIFNPDVDDSSREDSSIAPKKGNVHFLEKSGSRFRERLNSDASMNLLKAYTGVTKVAASPSSSASPVPTSRPTRRFFNGLRARSVSRNREDRPDIFTSVSPRPPLMFPGLPSILGLNHHLIRPIPGTIPLPAFGTNASWVNIQPSPSLDLLRPNTIDVPPVNPFLQGKTSPRPGIPFPREKEKERSVFSKISTVVARPFSPSSETGSIPRSTLPPMRRTQSRPPEATEARMTPLRTNFAMSFSTPQSNPTSRALTTMELL